MSVREFMVVKFLLFSAFLHEIAAPGNFRD